ncbi:hypothetical protein AN214_02455 [Pseudoalteromonas sp. P1-9]|uniref:hypothetical protein n=1 Tax=Pseudoalteromonas sp. P1-9 TaxID=1710354 RepID=UPI0006D5E33C|nr:hypothetical protein [Pseudoalteromonas sp. P1-9]KPV95537.1 hypothetical protein AN214_02455 [Pseudoalteromonas sp. P1-9]
MTFRWTFLALALSSAPLIASPNYGIAAKNNQDPVFIEKCDVYQQAQKEGDLETLKSFVDQVWFEGSKAKRAEQALLKKAARFEQRVSKAGNYIVIEKRLSDKTQDNFAEVLINWTNGDKFSSNDGCVFEKIKDSELWRIHL